MKSHRHIISTIFLAMFCLIQLADIHIFTHHDGNDTDCQICLLCFDKQDDGFLPIEITEIPDTIDTPENIVLLNYEQQYFSIILDHSSLNKAPPATA